MVALVILVGFLAEDGMGVNGGGVLDAWGVADGARAEDVAIFSFVHLKRTLEYYRNEYYGEGRLC